MGRDSSCSLLLGNKIFGELSILWNAGIKGCGKLINLYQMETYAVIRTPCKLISKDFSPVFRTEIMVSFHKFWLWNKLKSFDVFSFIRFEGLIRFSPWKVWRNPLFSCCLGFCSKLIGFNHLWIHLIFKEFCWISV